MTRLDEPELADDYPVFAGYLYVIDGAVIESDITGTVRDLKRDTQAKSVTRCDIIGRSRMVAAMKGAK